MDKYRPCPSIIAMFTSDSQHPPRSRHAVYLGDSNDSFKFIHKITLKDTGSVIACFRSFQTNIEYLTINSECLREN